MLSKPRPMRTGSPRWLDIVRHRISRFRAPFLLIVQHHAITASTRLAAPVTLPLTGDMDILAPQLMIDGVTYRARPLDLTAVPNGILGQIVASAEGDSAAIMAALDAILHGYPVGLPL